MNIFCYLSWSVDISTDNNNNNDDDDDDDDLTSISNTTHSKNNDQIVLSQLECRFFIR